MIHDIPALSRDLLSKYPYRDFHLLGSHNNNDIDHKIPPDLPLSKGGITPLWPPAHRASLRGMSPSLRAGGLSEPEAGAEPGPEGKEGLAPWSGETYSTGRGEIL